MVVPRPQTPSQSNPPAIQPAATPAKKQTLLGTYVESGDGEGEAVASGSPVTLDPVNKLTCPSGESCIITTAISVQLNQSGTASGTSSPLLGRWMATVSVRSAHGWVAFRPTEAMSEARGPIRRPCLPANTRSRPRSTPDSADSVGVDVTYNCTTAAPRHNASTQLKTSLSPAVSFRRTASDRRTLHLDEDLILVEVRGVCRPAAVGCSFGWGSVAHSADDDSATCAPRSASRSSACWTNGRRQPGAASR